MTWFDKIFKDKKTPEFPPRPKWKPSTPIDIDAIYEKAKYYTGEKLQFVIFKNGTVVFFPNHVEDIDRNATQILNSIFNSHPDFKPLSMDDGNYLIEYSQPAFTIVFKTEIEKHWDYIEMNHQDGICTSEVLINSEGEMNIFDKLGMISLFGRAKMFMDAQAPKVVRNFEPFA